MRQSAGWMIVALFCCATGSAASAQTLDDRLVEAQADFDAAKKLQTEGAYTEALVRAEHALALREAVLGGSHLEASHCLDLTGNLYRQQGDLERAEPLLQRALALREAALGNTHPDVASSLNNLANLYLAQGLYAQAEPLYQRALALREAALGNTHPDVSSSLNNLALLYVHQESYSRAEPLLLRAIALREAAVGKNHPDIAKSLTSLATLYTKQGAYVQAEHLFLRALKIREASLSKGHPDIAQAINNLASIYLEEGFYSQAEPLLQRALSLREETLGQHHPDVSNSLNSLANLYIDQGWYDRAEPLMQRALAIRETAFGNKNHPDIAASLNNLATFYADQGKYERARPLQERALAIWEAALGKRHPSVALSLDNLANLYADLHLYVRAATLYRRALAIREETLGKNHPDVASSLHNLAVLYTKQGLYGQAEPLYRQALAVGEVTLGKAHPYVATFLNDLAQLLLAQRRLDEALPLITRAFSISEQRLRKETLGFSESRLSGFLQHLRAEEETLYALLRAYPDDPRVQRMVLSAALLLKGRSVEEAAETSRIISQHLGVEERAAFEQLRGLRTQWSALSLEGPGELTAGQYQQRLKDLAEEGDVIEERLARASAGLAFEKEPPLNEIVDRVAASLPKDSVLVEFIAYEDSPLVPRPGKPRVWTDKQSRYLALVLLPDASIRTVDLGSAAAIDAAASRLRDALANRAPGVTTTAQQLERLVFRPLRPLLDGARHVFLSPDGPLNIIPFDALHDGDGFLLDSFDFTYLTGGRELLPRPQGRPPSTSVFVLADPRFSPAPASTPVSNDLERSSSHQDLTRSIYSPLPGTRLEAEEILRLLPQAQLFLGAEATKERLIQLRTPGILHLATHGFFLGSVPSAEGSRGLVLPGLDGGAPPPQREPLLNSGLVLAGPPVPGTSPSPSEISLVTALELAGLDLWGTQLVVLSACDTGRGEVRPGQGVYGLRRALVVAGAESVITSLWKVSDGTTPELMNTYYRNLLAGQGRAFALREAMRSFRVAHPGAHPHDWAAFIALGSDAPLHDIIPTGPPLSRP